MAFDEWETQFPYKPPAVANWTTCGVRMGPDGTNALEVVWGSGGSGTVTALRKVWKDRKSSRVNPVVAVHYSDSKALLMGPGREGTDPPARTIGDVDQLAKLLNTALSLPDRHQARRFLDEFLPGVGDPALGVRNSALGVRNSGLLSTHALMRISPQRDDWPQLAVRGKALLDQRRRELMEGLGFTVEQSSAQHSILKVDDKSAAIALFLERDEASDRIIERFGSESPVLYALRIAEREQLKWVVITAGPSVRLYPTSTTVGVGRRGRTETFCEVRLDLLSETNSGYLPLLFSDDALKPDGYLMDLIERSSDHVANLGIRLRERIYGEVLPRLATGIANARNLVNPTATDLRETHDMALTLLFRLLFVSYAEDRILLPYRENEAYTEIALKTLARRFTDDEQEVEMKQSSTAMWDDVAAIVKAVHDGRPDWSIPPYGGAPFSEAEETSPSGSRLTEISLSDDVFGPVLRSLLVDVGSEGEGPIDFSELSVREFGTVYEGLLESELALAEDDLAEDNDGYYRLADENDSVVVSAGSYYLHNSGQRKSTASFYTPSFAVEHLLDSSLEPALEGHLSRIDEIEDVAEAAKALFDFRVADIAMGSGHFLIAAIDHIERRFSNYLQERSLLGVREELNRLWRIAAENTGKDAKEMGIGPNHLLRRQIARRCVYGVDINPTAVELARVSVWIHTFVPGLPLSFLDWRLRCGNSIIGIATQDEANGIIKEHGAQMSLFQDWVGDSTDEVAEIARQMADIGEGSDTTLEEVEEAMENYRQTRDRLSPWKALMDVMCASRLEEGVADKLGRVVREWKADPQSVEKDRIWPTVKQVLAETQAFHYQIEFPEVFWRENPGFDVIVGNPPWEKAHVEEHEFWSRYIPGFKGFTQTQREKMYPTLRVERDDLVKQFEQEVNSNQYLRKSLLSGGFKGMGTGHPDLYKAFCWRFLHTTRTGGRIGVVLPRAVFSSLGTSEFRTELLSTSNIEYLTTLTNSGGWVFEDVHPQYTVALAAIKKGEDIRTVVRINGPFTNLSSYTSERLNFVEFPMTLLENATDNLIFPLLPIFDQGIASQAIEKMLSHTRLDTTDLEWRFRPVQGDLNATHGKPYFDFDDIETKLAEGNWKVYKGASFDVHNPDRGEYYATITTDTALEVLQNRRSQAREDSAFGEKGADWVSDPNTLPCLHPRIAFRNISRATDTRTIRCSMTPSEIVIQHSASYLLRVRGSESDEAFVLGALASVPVDWFARRFIELQVGFYIFNPLRIPIAEAENPLRKRIESLVASLYVNSDSSLREWAMKVDSDCITLNDAERQESLYEIEAIICLLFGLNMSETRTIYRTFHHNGTVDGEPWEQRYEAVMEHYKRWSD